MHNRHSARAAGLHGLSAVVLILAAMILAACGPDNSGPAATPTPAVGIESLVTARGIGDRNAPQDQTTTFAPGDTVYAVARVTRLPAGTRLFARWSANGTVREDTSELTADRDYTNTYVEFHISGTQQNLEAGNWTVQLFVNGNPGPQTGFQIR
jgi:hypothetical protein